MTVTVQVPASTPDAGPMPAPVPTTAPAPPTPDPLARTGLDAVDGLGAALLLVAAGAHLLVGRRLLARRPA